MYNANDFILGVDIGGSHITVGVVDSVKKAVLDQSIIRREVNCHGRAHEILSAWSDAILHVQNKFELPVIKVGFAMPGPFDYENGISFIKGFDKFESLYGMNIRNELAARLKTEPHTILFRNDAEAFLEGERFCGAAAGFQHAIGITLGTGLGSAVSHLGITRDAERSVLQLKGEMIEEWVSTRGLIRIYREITGKRVKDAQTIADMAATDAHARETFQLFSNYLGWFLHKFISDERPEVLVIGGNIANAYHLFMNHVMDYLQLAKSTLPIINRASLGENAALIGAACLFIANMQHQPALLSQKGFLK